MRKEKIVPNAHILSRGIVRTSHSEVENRQETEIPLRHIDEAQDFN
jgi:hypothetical protein